MHVNGCMLSTNRNPLKHLDSPPMQYPGASQHPDSTRVISCLTLSVRATINTQVSTEYECYMGLCTLSM